MSNAQIEDNHIVLMTLEGSDTPPLLIALPTDLDVSLSTKASIHSMDSLIFHFSCHPSTYTIPRIYTGQAAPTKQIPIASYRLTFFSGAFYNRT
jgi:hypothetical protein